MHQKILIVSAAFGIALLFLGNSLGRASGAGKGNTGAPGDELNINGTFRTCQSCHNAGPITCSMQIEVLDENNLPITTYIAGKTYNARVTINSTSSGIGGYGFQMIGLRKQGNVDLKGFKDLLLNNYKLVPISNGRIYAEHNGVSPEKTFNVAWVAPVAGTGDVKFYASGNAVNANNLTSGDGAALATLEIPEDPSSATEVVEGQSLAISVTPLSNPVTGSDARFQVSGLADQQTLVRILDMSGKVHKSVMTQPSSGQVALPIDALPSGVYIISIVDGSGRVATCKFVRI